MVTWFALDYQGKVLSKGADKEKVKSEDAKYYIEYFWDKYTIYDRSFNLTVLKHNGIVGQDKVIKSSANSEVEKPNNLKFFLTDKSGKLTSALFGDGIEAFEKCLGFMDKLGKYSSKGELKLQEKVKRLEAEIKELKAENQKLKAKLELVP